MNIVLWILQILLGLLFLAAGAMKATQSKEKIMESGERMAWVEDFSPTTIKIIGVLELLGGLGLILPQVTGILPWLPPAAAIGLVLTMIGAILTHIRRRDGAQPIVMNVVLLLLAAFVAYGRLFVVAY